MNSKAPDSYRGLFNYLCRSPTVVKTANTTNEEEINSIRQIRQEEK